MQTVIIERLWIEHNTSCSLKTKKSNRIHGMEEANAISSKATKSDYPFMRAAIGKSHGLVPSIISLMFIYDYVNPYTIPIINNKFQNTLLLCYKIILHLMFPMLKNSLRCGNT